MTVARQRLGRHAERIAAERLSASGWQVIARNARTREGELDLVALDRDSLVFVVVKAARAGRERGPERAALAVGARKRLRLRRLAKSWLAERPPLPGFAQIRFDVIGIELDHLGRVLEWDHIRDAF
jgi:putative endonuclease